MRKFIQVLMMFSIMFLFTSCEEDKLEVAVLLYDLNDPFIESVGEFLLDYNEDNYNITIYDCQKSQILQNETAEKLYDDGVDLLIINPVERLSSYIFVKKSFKENIPVIFFNREPLREDLVSMKQAYYVGANATESGIMQAEMITEGFGGNPSYLNQYDKNGDDIIQCIILKGEQGHQDAEERTAAVIDELENQGFEVEVLLTQIANWSENEAYRDMSDIMDAHGDEIELLISNNDAMAIGASKYLVEHKLYTLNENKIAVEQPFLIVGIDGIDEAISLIEKGYMYGTILNDRSNMAKAILELSEYVLEGNKDNLSYDLVDDKYIWIPYQDFSYE